MSTGISAAAVAADATANYPFYCFPCCCNFWPMLDMCKGS